MPNYELVLIINFYNLYISIFLIHSLHEAALNMQKLKNISTKEMYNFPSLGIHYPAGKS